MSHSSVTVCEMYDDNLAINKTTVSNFFFMDTATIILKKQEIFAMPINVPLNY